MTNDIKEDGSHPVLPDLSDPEAEAQTQPQVTLYEEHPSLPAEPKRKVNTLGNYRAGLLAKALEPMVKRVPNADGTLPEEPKFGISEFVDPTMNYVKAAAAVRPLLHFPITDGNVKGCMEEFYGRPRLHKQARKRGPDKAPRGSRPSLTAEQATNLAMVPHLVEQVGKLAELVHKVHKAVPKVEAHDSKLAGLTQVMESTTRDIGKLNAIVARLDRDTVKKAGSEDLEAAFSTSSDKLAAKRLALRDKYRKE